MRVVVGVIELLLAAACIAAAAVCWNVGVDTYMFEAADGAPAYAGTRYSGSWIALAAVAVVVAGLLIIDGARRLLQQRLHTG